MSEPKSKIESLRGRVWHETVDDLFKCLEKHDEKIRTDAIDEFKQRLFDNLFDDGLWRCVTESNIDEIAEELKEQRGE